MLSAEGEQLRSEIGRPARSGSDLTHILPQRVAHGETGLDQICVSFDNGQNVVEIVRNSSREPAHRLQLSCLLELFLSLSQGLLRVPHFRQVKQQRERADVGAVAIPLRSDGQLYVPHGSVGPNDFYLGAAFFPTFALFDRL